MLRAFATLVSLMLLGCQAVYTQQPSVTDLAVMSCWSKPALEVVDCIQEYQLLHQVWRRDCRIRNISAVESRSGRDERRPWCIITPNHSFWAQVIVEPGRVYFRNMSDFDSRVCGYGPKIAVDGQRIDRQEEIVPAMMSGALAVAQQQRPWPTCMLIKQKIALSGLRLEVEAAKRWVAIAN